MGSHGSRGSHPPTLAILLCIKRPVLSFHVDLFLHVLQHPEAHDWLTTMSGDYGQLRALTSLLARRLARSDRDRVTVAMTYRQALAYEGFCVHLPSVCWDLNAPGGEQVAGLAARARALADELERHEEELAAATDSVSA